MLKLYLKEKNGRLYYGIGSSFRFIYLMFAGVILIGAWAYLGDQDTVNMGVPVVIAVILLIASAYQEQWIFDQEEGTISYRIGLIFLSRRKRIPFDQVEVFELNHFKKGQKAVDSKIKSRANRMYNTFAVALLTGEKHDIEIIRHRKSAGRTEQAAAAIARYCGKPLVQDMQVGDDVN